MSTKKYKLLKPLPDCDESAIFIYNESTGRIHKDGNVMHHGYKLDSIASGWFAPVNEGVEVTELEISHYHRREKGNAYHFSCSIDIPKDKLPLIKEAISKCLNEVGEVKPVKTWEIVSLITPDKRIINDKLSIYHFEVGIDNRHKEYKIYSVKTIGGTDIFSVGDEICWDWVSSQLNSFIIEGFEIDIDGSLRMLCDHTKQNFSIVAKSNLRIYSPKPIPEKPFTLSQLNEERRKAFEAGRDRIGGAWNDQIKNWTYPTFDTYKNKFPKN